MFKPSKSTQDSLVILGLLGVAVSIVALSFILKYYVIWWIGKHIWQ